MRTRQRERQRERAAPVAVRLFRDDDYVRLAEITTRSSPDEPENADEIRFHDSAWDHGRYFRARFAAEDAGGRVLGLGRVNHIPDEFHPDKYFLSIVVDPDHRHRGVGSALYEHMLAVLRGRGAIAVRAAVERETHAEGIAFLTRRGFVEVQRAWQSRLDVAAFDFARFAGAEERAARQGIVLTTLAAERARDPEAVRKAYELTTACERDVPAVDEVTPTPYESFVKYALESPFALPEAFFIALDGDRHVGLSIVFRRPEQPDVAGQGLTGVLREYRGRGIAMALKLQTVRYARAHGYREIRTWNDTRNRPMLRINEAMGFAKQPAGITYERALG